MNWQWMMGTARNRSFWRVTLAVALTLASSALIRATAKEPTVDELEAELKALDLLKYCRSALEQRRKRP